MGYDEKVAKILFSPHPHHGLDEMVKAHKVFLENEKVWNRLLYICVHSQSWDNVARIVMAGEASANPGLNYAWYDTITQPFYLEHFEASREYVWGVTLGLFETVIWLDNNWKSITYFEETLTRLIMRLIRNPGWYASLVDPMLPYPEWESRLSSAIKAWGRRKPKDDEIDHVGERRTDEIYEIYKKIFGAEHDEPKAEISRFGSVILSQLNYILLPILDAPFLGELLYQGLVVPDLRRAQ